MSQGGATSLPPSRPSSRSPNSESRHEPLRHEATGSEASRTDRAVSGYTEQGNQRGRSRSSIGDVLNPVEHQYAAAERRHASAVETFVPQRYETESASSTSSTLMTHRNSQHPGVEQHASRAIPVMPDGSRRILSPRGPRAASASHALGHFNLSPQVTSGVAGVVNPFPNSSASTLRAPSHQFPPISSAASLPGTPSVAAPQPVRTNSQPTLGLPPVVPAPLAPAASRRPWPAPGQPPQPPHVTEAPAAFPRSVSSSVVNSPMAWQDLVRERQNLAVSEGTEVSTGRIGDVEIQIGWDLNTGSSKQSQKRSRNAEASGRHRSKRKAQTSDMQKEIEALKEEKAEYQAQIQELTRERDFYRDDRNRLRDLASRTPQIAHLAASPLSPRSLSTNSVSQPSTNAPTTRDSLATELRQQYQAYPSARETREMHQETSAFPSGMNIYSQGQPPNHGNPSAPSESGHPGMNLPESQPEHRPPLGSRSASATQLPPIGTMGGLIDPPAQGQSREPSHQQEQWWRTRARPNPGWATEKPETTRPPSR
ncbi:hypothetical protein CC79DRAFT_1362161 [Sarocladium strictum]